MKIGKRFTLWIISLVALIGLFSAYIYYRSEVQEEKERLESLGGTIGPLLEHSLDNYMLTRDLGALDDTLNKLKNIRPIRRIRLVNRDGVIKASTVGADVGERLSMTGGECRGCHEKRLSSLFLRDEGIFRWVQPVANKRECNRCHAPAVRSNGVFIIDFSTAEFESYARRNIVKEFMILTPSVGLIGLAIFLLSNIFVIKRLNSVTDKINRFKEGDYTVRIGSGGDDEITRLEEGFNEMAEALHAREREKNLLFRQASRSYLEWQYTFDSITELIAIIDAGFGIVRVNRTFAEYFGLGPDEWRSRNCLEFFYGEVPRNGNPFRSTTEKHMPVTEEIADGRGRIFRVSMFPYTYPEADFTGAILVAKDITAEKEKEKALRKSDEKRKLIIENINEVVYMVSLRDDPLHGSVEFVSPQVKNIAGYEPAEFLRDPSLWVSAVHPDDVALLFETTGSILAEGATGVRQYRMRHKENDEYRWLEDKIVPQTDSKGDIIGYFGAARDITLRKKTEDALQEQLHFLQVLINAIPNPVFYKDARGIYLGCNEAFQSFLGLGREQIIGKSVFEVSPKELADRYHEADLSLLTAPGFQNYESSVLHSDGARHDVIFYKSTLLGPDGSVAGLVGTVLDITDRKQAEKIIRRNYDMQTVINAILNDSQEEISLDEMLQRSIEHILSIDWLSVRTMGSISLVEGEPDVLVMKAWKNIPQQLQSMCARVHFGECICGRAASTREVQMIDHIDHRHEICYENVSPHGHYCVPILHLEKTIGVLNLYLDEGTTLSNIEKEYFGAIAAALAGIVRHKRAEQERENLILRLREALDMVSRSQKEWQDTFDSITDLVSIHDSDYNIIKANKAFALYFGLTPNEVIKRKCYDLFHEAGASIPQCPNVMAIRDNRTVTEEISDGKSGSIFRISTFPYYSPEGEAIGTVHIARDITEEKRNEMRLIMSERLASLGQMASGIAHEINNPLAAIAGCTEGLLNRVRKGRYDNELFENYLKIIVEEISRCKSITSGMLSFVRKATYEKRDIDINSTMEKTIEIIGFQGRIEEVRVTREYKSDLPPVKGSEGELRQIFITIITNALDAMQEKGTLAIRTDSYGDKVILEISDTGEGISPGDIDRVFDPFFTTKSDRGGTGMGLSIARKIVLNHNGTIDVTSEKEKGTTFRISLPAVTRS